MLDRFQFLQMPIFEEEEQARLTRILSAMLLIFVAGGVLLLINGWLGNDRTLLLVMSALELFLLTSLWLLQRGHLALPAFLIPFIMLILVTYLVYTGGGLHDIGVSAYSIVIVTAGLLLGRRLMLIFTGICIAILGWMTYAEITGLHVTHLSSTTGYDDFINATIILLVFTVLLQLIMGNLTDSLARTRQNEKELLEKNRELQAVQVSLEERVSARTQGLQLVTTLSERLNAILDVDQLLNELVNQVQTSFGYYHVQVYILDASRQNLVIRAGTGTVGARLKEQQHTIPLDAPTSLVARAARTRQIVKADNVKEVTDWLYNVLLPDTQAEMAIPIIVEGQVSGILDVQADKIAGLDEGDLNVLRSLANQVAVALRNAYLFDKVQASLDEVRLVQQQYIQEAWQASITTQPEAHYHRPGSPTLPESVKTKLKQLAKTQEKPAVIRTEELQSERHSPDEPQAYTALVAPIKLQNQVIGTMQFLAADPSQRQWKERELALIQAVADQVAQTAENLRLFEQIRQRAGREQTIREITDKLRTAPNLDFLLETAARELSRQLGVPQTVIELGAETDAYQAATDPVGQNGH